MATFANQQPAKPDAAAPVTSSEPSASEQYNKFMSSLPPVASSTDETSTPITAPAGPSYGDEVAGAFKGSVDQMKEGAAQINSGNPNPMALVEGVGKIGAGGISSILSPVAPILNHTLGALTGWLSDKIADNPGVQKFADTRAGQMTADAAGDVANYSTIAGTVGGAMGGVDAVQGAMEPKILTSEELAAKAKGAVTPEIAAAEKEPWQTVPVDDAGNPITPVKGAGAKTIPRIQMSPDGSDYQGVNNTKAELDAAQAGAQSPGWQKLMNENPDALYKAQQNAVQPDIAAKDTALKAQLAEEPATVKPSNLYGYMSNALKGLAGKGYAMGEAGNSALQAYMDQLSESFDNIAKGSKAVGLDDIYKLKQEMTDKYIARAGDTKLGPPDTQLRALDIIQKTGNQAFTEFIDGLAKDTEVKAALKSASDLHNFYDALGEKATSQAKTWGGRFAQAHPNIAGFGRYIMRYGIRRAMFGMVK